MRQIYKPVFLFTFYLLLNTAQCQKQCSRSKKLNSLLQSVLTPGNLETLKQLKIAARRNKPVVNCANANPLLNLPANVFPTAYLPSNTLPNAYPPANVLPTAYLPSNLLPSGYLPANLLPTGYLPSNFLSNVPICQKQCQPKLVEAVDIPKRTCETCACQAPASPPVVLKEPPVLPQRLVNPYLPAASPVSALAPTTSSLLPPADYRKCRCNFLRKIPIPPPTI